MCVSMHTSRELCTHCFTEDDMPQSCKVVSLSQREAEMVEGMGRH